MNLELDESVIAELEGKAESTLYDTSGNLNYVPLINDSDGCSYWRIRKPFETMGLDLLQDNKTLEQHLETAKLVTFNRWPGLDMPKYVALKAKYGFKTVIDWDDWFHLPPDHMLYKGWMQNQFPKMIDATIKEIADAIIVTTERLAGQFRRDYPNKPVYVIPNAVDFEDEQWFSEGKQYGGEHTKTLLKSGKVVDTFGTRFGYVAGSSHLPDLRHVAPFFNHFPTLKFALAGYNNPQAKSGAWNVWDSMERICSFNFHNPNYRRIATKPLQTYGTSYDQIDVAIAPLKPNAFNTFKSSLKAYEAGAKRCALICSDIAPYADDVPRDVATFCGKNAEWVDAIKRHKDLEFVKEQAAKLHEWVRLNRDIRQVNKLRLEIYQQIENGK